jgi:2Fe-2S type ferredoxin
MATYKVNLINASEGLNSTLDCADDQSILDAADEQAIDRPFSCRAASCASCAGKMISGRVDQEDQYPRRAGALLRCSLSRTPGLTVNGSPQLVGIGFPLLRSQQLAEQIPGHAHAILLRHGPNWGRRVAVSHDGLHSGVRHDDARWSWSDPPG